MEGTPENSQFFKQWKRTNREMISGDKRGHDNPLLNPFSRKGYVYAHSQGVKRRQNENNFPGMK